MAHNDMRRGDAPFNKLHADKKPLLGISRNEIVPEPLSGNRVAARRTGFTHGGTQRRLILANVSRNKGRGSLVTAMVKATWNDLLARFPQPHLLVAVLPASSEKESIFNAQSAQRLMVRLIKKLSTKADFAVTVSRQSGQREILCAFADSSDARLFASIANASVSDCARYSFLLDGSAEQKLLKIAGPPEPHRRCATAYDRWQY